METAIQVSDAEKQLIDFGVEKSKIKTLISNEKLWIEIMSQHMAYDENDRRVQWLRDYSNYVDLQKIQGSVCECGVNRGDFAYWINLYFPTRTLYLFDTFEGFDRRDLERERSFNDNNFFNKLIEKHE